MYSCDINFSEEDRNKKVRCPYVAKHRVFSHKLASHIQKCKKEQSAYFLSKFCTCRFNSLHIINKCQIQNHENVCPDRKTIQGLQKRIMFKEGDEQFLEQQSEKKDIQEDAVTIGSKSSGKSVKNLKEVQIKKAEDKKCEKNSVKKNLSSSMIEHNELERGVFPQKVEKCKSQLKPNFIFTQKLIKEQQEETQVKIIWKNTLQKQKCNQQQKVSKQVKVLKEQTKHNCVPFKAINQELSDCFQCTQILFNTKLKTWQNKQLIKLMKAYSKLQEESKQLSQFKQSCQFLVKNKNK